MLYNDNPFKILSVSPTDNRREIARQAEEKALLLDSQKCTDARTTLTNPQRRITAEIHWFLDCSAEEVKEIDSFISSSLAGNDIDDFSWENYCALTQLNIQLACLNAHNFNNAPIVKYYILGISRLFESVAADDILQLINDNRRKSGFPEVSKILDIESALGDMRSEIRQSLSQKLQVLPEIQYTKIVTLLSESYSGNQRYKGHAILEDAISEYQIYINDTLHKQGQAITKTAKFIAMGAQKINVSQAVSDLIDSLYTWDKLAQPLQLGALTKGSAHEESKEMLLALRDLALKLHNDFGMSSESLAITKATQEVFKELTEYIELLSDDNKTLTRLIEEKDAEDILSPILETVLKAFEALKSCPENQRTSKLNNLITCIKGANVQIKKQISDKKEAASLRNALGMLAHSFAVALHNDHQRTDDSISIVNAIEPLFADLPEVAEKIQESKKVLNELESEQAIISEIKAIENIIEKWKTKDTCTNPYQLASNAITKDIVDDLIAKIKATNSRIKAINETDETIAQLRTGLCITAREGAIYAHNERNKTELALSIARVLLDEFGDLATLRGKLAEDVATLNRQLTSQQLLRLRNQSTPSAQSSSSNSSTTAYLIAILIAVAIFVVVGFFSGAESGNSSSSDRKPSSYSPSSYNQSTETRFSSSSKAGNKVYADIVSIFPAIGIYTEGSSTYSNYVCECKTSSGTTVWVYISVSKYRSTFDSDASSSIYSEYAEEITFPSSKRIHGVVKSADSVMHGLSADTGSTLLINFGSVD